MKNIFIFLAFAFPIYTSEPDRSEECEWPDNASESSSFSDDIKDDTEDVFTQVEPNEPEEEFGPFVSAPAISKPETHSKGFFVGLLALICSWLCCRSR